MKRILLASAIALAGAGTVWAETAANGLPAEIRQEVQTVAPGVDFAALSPTQVAALSQLNLKSNGNTNADDRAAYIRVVLGWTS